MFDQQNHWSDSYYSSRDVTMIWCRYLLCVWSLPPPHVIVISNNTAAAATTTRIKTQTCNLYSLFWSGNFFLPFIQFLLKCEMFDRCTDRWFFEWEASVSSLSISLLIHCQKPHNAALCNSMHIKWRGIGNAMPSIWFALLCSIQPQALSSHRVQRVYKSDQNCEEIGPLVSPS